MNTQSANTVFAGPTTGAAAAPTFRTIVSGDIPTLNQNTTGTASNVTGIVAVAHGGTGSASTPTNGQLLIGNGSGYTLSTLTPGSGIGITNAAGTITITNNSLVNIDGGQANSNYGAISPINGGNA